MRPNRKSELAHWIRTSLGSPVINLSELDGTQIEDRIEEAIDYFTEFAGGIGHEEQYCVIQTHSCEELSQMGVTLTPISGSPYSFCEPSRIAASFLNVRNEYQLPKNVFAVSKVLPNNSSQNSGLTWLTGVPTNQEIIQTGLNAAEGLTNYGASYGSGTMNTSINNIGAFFPGVYYTGGPYGSKGGSRGNGWGADVVTMELGRMYMETLNQMYRIQVDTQFLEASRKVRITSRVPAGGTLVLGVWARVADEHLYDNLFVKRYALALCKQQIGVNLSKYTGMKMPGGVALNAEFYYREGKEDKEKLEKEIQDNFWSEPQTPFYIG